MAPRILRAFTWRRFVSAIPAAGLAALVSVTLPLAAAVSARAQQSAEQVLSAVVRVSAEIPPEARTAPFLGTRREGNGVVIDEDGLVLTIGYLILESMSVTLRSGHGEPVIADFVAYDHASGFGLVRARQELGAKPLRLGDSAALKEREPVLVVAHGGMAAARPAYVASRREFAGYWEYLLENAIFTVPPHANWSGAALIDGEGRLVGIGSLIVDDATGGDASMPGNMFVPIDLLKPILSDLIDKGRRAGPPRPWLGMFSTTVPEGALVARVAPGSPAERAGIEAGDVVIGIGGAPISGLADLYRKLWSGPAVGAAVSLTVRRGLRAHEVTVISGDREHYLRLRPSY